MSTSSNHFSLRQATAADAQAIKDLIHRVGINPMSLEWPHFWLAIDGSGQMIGCGQIKPHGDGSRELASIAVVENWRGQGVARAIIEHLLAENPGRLYLTCRSPLQPLYAKFGFRRIEFVEMTPYFRRIMRIVGVIKKLGRMDEDLCVMVIN